MTASVRIPRSRACAAGLSLRAARNAMLRALADGAWRPAGELARVARIGTTGARADLDALVDAGKLTRRGRGRRAYYALGPGCPGAPMAGAVATVPLPTQDAALRYARTCYGHLAGQLGVALCEAWLACGWLRVDGDAFHLTPAAMQPLLDAGWPRPVAARWMALAGHPCIDWTERRPHLGGALGKAVAQEMLGSGWLLRADGSRAVVLTDRGRRGFRALGVALPRG